MLSLESTLEKIREKELPFWKLKFKGSPKVYDSFDTNDLDASIDYLEKSVHSVQNDKTIFEIEAKNSATSNGDKVKFWPFTVSGEYPRMGGTQNFGGLSGLGAMDVINLTQSINQQYESKLAEVERKKEKLDDEREKFRDAKSEFLLNKAQSEHELTRREKEIERKEIEFKQNKKELDELLEKRAKQGEVVFGKILGNQLNKFLSPEDVKSLSGTQQETKTPEEQTSQEKIIQSIADNLLDNVQDVDQLKKIGIAIQILIKNPEAYHKLLKTEETEETEIPEA